jgi:AcrR family transcriptional regulator
MADASTLPPRRHQIVDAAIKVFLRYGYARTTMVDIAQAAGLTRPTLYASFPEKESIFSAVVATMVAAKMAEIREGLQQHRNFEAKLRFACDAWAGDGYDLVRNHPDAADMFDLGFRSVCDGYDGFTELLAEILAEPVQRSNLKLSGTEIATTIVYALRGFKDRAQSSDEMRDMIRIHVALVAAAVGDAQLRERNDHG